jgi:hypothetical protein
MKPYTVETSPPLSTLRVGSKGRDVRRLQEWLCLRGEGVQIDGDFGPATKRALSIVLPGEQELTAEGWDRLISPLLTAIAPSPWLGNFGQTVAQKARAHFAAAAREVGGDNRGPWVRHYCRGFEVAWCQGFASTIYNEVSNLSGKASPLDLVLEGIWCLYVPRMVTEARAKGIFRSGAAASPTPGSMFFLRGGSAGHSHVGIVISNNLDGTMTTIEGNTNDDGSPNGYEVAKRTRSIASCDYAII